VYDGPLKWDGHRALIYDAKLEVIPELAGMGLSCPVHILNPFDERCAAWDMAADITEPAVAKQIAAIFIPDEKNSSQPFFKDSSRQLLEGVFISFILTQKNNWTFRDVLNATKSREALVGVLGATPYTSDLIGHYLNSDRETKSTLATLATKLGAFDVVAALWDSAEHKISLREWLDSESILVLGNDEAYRSTLGVINRVIFNRIVELLLARKSTTTGRTWFFLDEVKEAGELEALDRLMTKGRSFGAAVVLGFQNINGLYETFGENPAKSILGQCATKVFLRVDSPETAEWAQSVFGEYEATEIKQSATLGESESEGESFTSGRSSSHTETSGSSFSGLGANATRGTNQSSSESTSTSESKSTSSTSGTNRSLSKSAEVVKRSLVLASEFMHLPMTNRVNGLNGYISHHLGKARFRFSGFEHELLPASDTEERVRYRPSSQQFLRPWSEGEATRFIPKRTDVPPSATTSSSGSLVNETQPEPTKNLGQALAGLKSRQGRGRSLLPSSNPENGLVRES
jgi:type IV secretory pathway TraG/TraD family ATPase VirD4